MLNFGHKQTRGPQGRAGATKDEVYRAIEGLTPGELLKLKHFVACGVRGLGRASRGADLGGSAERSELFDFGRCIAALVELASREEAMTSRDPSARRSDDSLVALLGPVLAAFPGTFFLGGVRLYLYVLVGFALMTVWLNPRELSDRVRNRRGRSLSTAGGGCQAASR
jgi:hypothetical protein